MAWPYCPVEEIETYFDPRVLRSILSDTGTDLPQGGAPGSATLLSMVTIASARIDTALQSGRKYDWQTLSNFARKPDGSMPTDFLPGVTPPMLRPDQGIILRKLCATLAMSEMQQRRSRPNKEADDLTSPSFQWAETMLDKLSGGFDVLGLAANMQAGLPSRVRCRPHCDPFTPARVFPNCGSCGDRGIRNIRDTGDFC